MPIPAHKSGWCQFWKSLCFSCPFLSQDVSQISCWPACVAGHWIFCLRGCQALESKEADRVRADVLVSDLRATIRELRAKAGQGHGQGAGEIRASRFDSPSATLDSLSAAVFDLRALRTQPPSSSAAGGAAYTSLASLLPAWTQHQQPCPPRRPARLLRDCVLLPYSPLATAARWASTLHSLVAGFLAPLLVHRSVRRLLAPAIPRRPIPGFLRQPPDWFWLAAEFDLWPAWQRGQWRCDFSHSQHATAGRHSLCHLTSLARLGQLVELPSAGSSTPAAI